MSGWRDGEGRTAGERRKLASEQARARFAGTLRHRPHALVKPILSALFIVVLIIALLLTLR